MIAACPTCNVLISLRSVQLQSTCRAKWLRCRCTNEGELLSCHKHIHKPQLTHLVITYNNMQARKSAPLARGGTLSGDKAAGKVCNIEANTERHIINLFELETEHFEGAALTQLTLMSQEAGSGVKTAKTSEVTLQLVDGKFRDSRWQEGRWVLDKFKMGDGSMDWDKVCMPYMQHGRAVLYCQPCLTPVQLVILTCLMMCSTLCTILVQCAAFWHVVYVFHVGMLSNVATCCAVQALLALLKLYSMCFSNVVLCMLPNFVCLQ